ncbi:MAG: ATP-binding protein, partial [Proteobacteria bacterium]|nr:ATP-binding protein [Pseudomonadota bacterium]
RIKERGHCSLTAQRRMGKTSLARELCRQLEQSGDYYCFFVDIEEAQLPEDVIKDMVVVTKGVQSLWEKGIGLFGNVLGGILDRIEEISAMEVGIKIRAGLDAGNWQEKGDALFNLMGNQDKPVLVVIDELSIFINRLLKNKLYEITPESRELTDVFLSWLRKNAQAHRGKINIIISGSIGLDPILKQAGLNAATNVFPAYELAPWDKNTTCECLNALANQYDIHLQADVCEKIYVLLGSGIPHYVQNFFDALHTDAQHRETTQILATDVDRVFKQVMLSVRGTSELEHYESRLKEVLGESLYTLALDMLTETAVNNTLDNHTLLSFKTYYQDYLEKADDAIKTVLYVLEHDGYIYSHGNGYSFVLNLLKEWWLARHKTFYVSIRDRIK